jgi:hypothetical protein
MYNLNGINPDDFNSSIPKKIGTANVLESGSLNFQNSQLLEFDLKHFVFTISINFEYAKKCEMDVTVVDGVTNCVISGDYNSIISDFYYVEIGTINGERIDVNFTFKSVGADYLILSYTFIKIKLD